MRDGWAQGPSAEAASYKAFNSRRLKGTLGVVYQIIFAVVSFSGEATGQTGMYDLVLPVTSEDAWSSKVTFNLGCISFLA